MTFLTIRFVFPWALALLVLLPWTIWMGARIESLNTARKIVATTLRCVILIALIGALAGAERVLQSDELAVFFLLDHSDSIGEEARRAEAQTVRNLAEIYMTDKDKAGVIVFGDDASIELGMDKSLGLRDITSFVGGQQTDLASALRLAMAAFPQGHAKRVMIFTDGNETQGSAIEEAKQAQASNVEVNVIPLLAEAPQEVRVKEVSMPGRATADEPVQLRVVLTSTAETEATLRIFKRLGSDRRMMPEQRVTLQPGDNTFLVSEELAGAGFYEYEVSVESPGDTVPQNNTGRSFTFVEGTPQVLYAAGNPDADRRLIDALREEGINVVEAVPQSIPASLAQLQNFDAVVLSDVSATMLSSDQLRTLEAMVRDLGIGLVMVGGPSSFGAGGYLGSPVEAALPVDMDIKQRKILPKGALALILHTMEFPDGNAWAREISLAALNVLSPQDLMGILAYEYQAGDSWIHPLSPVGDRGALQSSIRVGSTNIGDMPAMGPTLQMAYDALVGTDAAAKRVLMISDGDAAMPSGSLLNDLNAAGIAVSTICIQPHDPSDQYRMKRISDETQGQFYFVNNPANLPQIFVKEAAIVKRGLLIEEPFVPTMNHESELLQGLVGAPMPELLGYVVTSPKENATVPLVSHEGDPVLAHWRYGLGKSVAFTSDASARWATQWLGWDGFNRFWAQSVRWAMRELSPTDFRVETSTRDGRGHVRIDAVDSDGKFINYLNPRGVVTGPGPDYDNAEIELRQTAPGIYEGDFPVNEAGVYMMNVLYNDAEGREGMLPAGLALGYSREYEYTETNAPFLDALARTGGGRVMQPDENPFEHTLEASPDVRALWPWLVIVAACLFPIEIFVRRVVVPVSIVLVPIRRALSAMPGIRNWVSPPQRRPAPVTGAYMAAPVQERRFEQAPEDSGPAGFGMRTDTSPVPGQAAEAEEEAPPPEPTKEESVYTRQLLDAKERAMRRKTKRIDRDS